MQLPGPPARVRRLGSGAAGRDGAACRVLFPPRQCRAVLRAARQLVPQLAAALAHAEAAPPGAPGALLAPAHQARRCAHRGADVPALQGWRAHRCGLRQRAACMSCSQLPVPARGHGKASGALSTLLILGHQARRCGRSSTALRRLLARAPGPFLAAHCPRGPERTPRAGLHRERARGRRFGRAAAARARGGRRRARPPDARAACAGRLPARLARAVRVASRGAGCAGRGGGGAPRRGGQEEA